MTTHFFELPAEVIILIVCHLPLRDVVACKQLCRQLRTLIEQSQLLQCHFRTMSSGVEDLFIPGIRSYEFLKSLELWEMAWRKFDIGDRFARHRYHNVLWTVEHVVQNGHIAAMRLGDSSWHTTPGWSYADISRVQMQGDEIPQELTWADIQLDIGISPKGYVLDVNQDLVAVIFHRDAIWRRIEIQFLRFTTGKPHDLASNAILELDLECKSPADCEIAMGIMGSNLVLLASYKTRRRLSSRHQEIYFVDWTRGYIHRVRRVHDGTYFPVITFVSKDLIVLARKRDFSLEVCKIVEARDSTTFTLQTVCILKLPSVHPRTRVRFQMRNRTPLAGHSSLPALHSSKLPFRSSPMDAVLGFEINVRRAAPRSGSESRRLAFWVCHSTFCKYAAQAIKSSRASPSSGKTRTGGMRGFASGLVNSISHLFTNSSVRQWHEWGPQSTRWLECSDDLRDRQTLSGTRCAIVHQGSLTLMDFNAGRLANLRTQGIGMDSGLKAVVHPNVIDRGRCFLHDFTSRLPYCVSTRHGVKNRVLMDDEWILQFECFCSQEEGLFGWEGYIDFHSIIPAEYSWSET
ncbi:hypothetical protein B0F90DRAFT_1665224 [Multifurca ochricompacta]|uniref:F-box domain-containing protein n=1 Tax=Multifurca ochricompacta TaxID=376703 RepID=A0AAD4MD25_9AGAM|nr:hypothetical protein B0F90DRAFT_1665224 [Multifurca ochricompacta]